MQPSIYDVLYRRGYISRFHYGVFDNLKRGCLSPKRLHPAGVARAQNIDSDIYDLIHIFHRSCGLVFLSSSVV